MSTKEYTLNTDNKLPTIRCGYCRRIAYWVRPRTGVQVCSTCKGLLIQRDWSALALRWLTYRPEDWVGDVAGFLEVDAEAERADLEHQVPLEVCEGCDGSICGSEPHRHLRVLAVPTVVAKPRNAKEDRG